MFLDCTVKLNETRIRELAKGAGLSIKEVADRLKMSRENLYDMFIRDYVKPQQAEAIAEILKVDVSDIVVKDVSDESKESFHMKNLTQGNIIYVPLFAYGGFLGGYRNTVFMDTLEHFRLPGVTGEHFAFEIGGFSMTKPGHELSATPGDIAISRMTEDFKHMVKGRGYILQTIDGILYKIFDKITDEKASFHSLNEDYDGLTIKLKDIKRVYFVSFILKKTY